MKRLIALALLAVLLVPTLVSAAPTFMRTRRSYTIPLTYEVLSDTLCCHSSWGGDTQVVTLNHVYSWRIQVNAAKPSAAPFRSGVVITPSKIGTSGTTYDALTFYAGVTAATNHSFSPGGWSPLMLAQADTFFVTAFGPADSSIVHYKILVEGD